MDRPLLVKLLTIMKMAPREILRYGEKISKDLNLKHSDDTDDQIIDLMILHPELIQRPILEIEDNAVLGRPIDNITDLINRSGISID
ncbi:MAG: hypothetical protein HOH43_13010 [Candidatus Latescibacteria bacterium]|jgi:arsenate reductase (glutaredoxin)|nr:hypothetical protein [Candidatus Latescibacterota bacterium]